MEHGCVEAQLDLTRTQLCRTILRNSLFTRSQTQFEASRLAAWHNDGDDRGLSFSEGIRRIGGVVVAGINLSFGDMTHFVGCSWFCPNIQYT